MKFLFLISFISLLPICGFGQIKTSTHHCLVYAVIERYDLASMKFKSATESTSDWFDVTSQPHEDQAEININSADGTNVGTAKVWTGTLLGTSEGDVIQAHADVKIENVSENLNLLMSLDSRLAKSQTSMDVQTQDEFILIAVDLKCEKQ